MQKEGKDYFLNKKEAIEKENLIKDTIKQIKISSVASGNIDDFESIQEMEEQAINIAKIKDIVNKQSDDNFN